MDENNVLKPDTENSNLFRISLTSVATFSSVQNVDPFAFEEVTYKVEVSTIYSSV